MKMEKFEDWCNDYNFPDDTIEWCRSDLKITWNHQQKKIEHILSYISYLGKQKELDRFLNNSKESI